VTKETYIQQLLYGMMHHPKIVEAAIIFWHCEIPYNTAEEYMYILESKLK
jgi:hypothetical protein